MVEAVKYTENTLEIISITNMRNTLRKILEATGAYDNKTQKAKLLHPIGLLFFILLLPVITIVCIFIDEGLIDTIKNNFKP